MSILVSRGFGKTSWMLHSQRFLNDLMGEMASAPLPDSCWVGGQYYQRVDGVLVRYPESVVGRVTLEDDLQRLIGSRGTP